MMAEAVLPSVAQDVADVIYGMVECLHQLSTRREIPYSIAAGTLLGAERHGGLIPWDDDADVYVLAKYA